MKQCKVIFMGTPAFACGMLKQLIADEYDVVAVVSQPDKKVGRKQVIEETPVKKLARSLEIEVLQPISIKEDHQRILDLGADLIVTCAYGQMIPDEVLNAPVYGSINVHASLLPKLRGGAPIHKAIMQGDKESGISIMRMVKKMDAGAVMAQTAVPIYDDDTTGILYDRLEEAGAKLLSESIPKILDGSAVFVEQKEEEATFAYNISKEEEWIDFSKSIHDIYNHIRALIPSPIGYVKIKGKKYKIHRVRLKQGEHIYDQGELVGMIDDAYAIAVKEGYILIDEIQMEGKGKVDAKSFYNGAGKQLIGERVEDSL